MSMSEMNLEHNSYVRKEQINELTEILVIVQFCFFRTSTLGLLPEDVKTLLRTWKEDVDFLLQRLNDLPF